MKKLLFLVILVLMATTAQAENLTFALRVNKQNIIYTRYDSGKFLLVANNKKYHSSKISLKYGLLVGIGDNGRILQFDSAHNRSIIFYIDKKTHIEGKPITILGKKIVSKKVLSQKVNNGFSPDLDIFRCYSWNIKTDNHTIDITQIGKTLSKDFISILKTFRIVTAKANGFSIRMNNQVIDYKLLKFNKFSLIIDGKQNNPILKDGTKIIVFCSGQYITFEFTNQKPLIIAFNKLESLKGIGKTINICDKPIYMCHGAFGSNPNEISTFYTWRARENVDISQIGAYNIHSDVNKVPLALISTIKNIKFSPVK